MSNVQNKTEESKETKKNEVVIKGRTIISYFGGSKHDKESKYRLALEVTDGMDALRKLYSKTCVSPLRPKWEGDLTETVVNLKSNFEIPLRGVEAFQDINPDAEMSVKVKVKETGIYPVAIVVSKNGKPIDPFEGM